MRENEEEDKEDTGLLQVNNAKEGLVLNTEDLSDMSGIQDQLKVENQKSDAVRKSIEIHQDGQITVRTGGEDDMEEEKKAEDEDPESMKEQLK